MATPAMQPTKVVSREEWLAARKELLAKEKQLTREMDALSAERRALPWVKVEKEYIFDTPNGEKSLADLFDGRSQLIVKHFMLGPGWKEGCVGCSFEVDHVEGALTHLEHHDVTFIAVARAPLAEIDFNFDYHVSFRPEDVVEGKINYNYDMRDFAIEELSGISVFYKGPAGNIFHTYSCYGRGNEKAVTSYMYLDLTPKGRNETGPRHDLGDWVRHHDRYGAGGFVQPTGRYVAPLGLEPACH
jgi:predicted dithiol-disulfide oxidoreductase (DUF899 family)